MKYCHLAAGKPVYFARYFIFGLIILLLGGCASAPAILPAPEAVAPEVIEPEAAIEPAPEPEAITYGLGQGDALEIEDVRVFALAQNEAAHVSALDTDHIDPWDWVDQADTASPNAVAGLLLKAAYLFIENGNLTAANALVTRLNAYPLIAAEVFSLNIVRAKLLIAAGENAQAIALLRTIPLGQIHDLETQIHYLSALGASQAALSRPADAAQTLINLDKLLATVPCCRRIDNQKNIIKILQSMDTLHLSLLRDGVHSPDLEGWITLATLLNDTDTGTDSELAQWRKTFPLHPVSAQIVSNRVGKIELKEYQQITLLLPLTSPFGNAAQAFYDGFMQAYHLDTLDHRPRLALYDIGEEPSLTSLYYQAALNEGADFIVGPLGRDAVEDLLKNTDLATDTLVIADVPVERAVDNLYSISLSPEGEAVQVARKAFADGHRHATIFRIEGEWGNRVADAFAAQWQAQGGIIVKNSSFPKAIDDYTRIIQKYLGLDKSIARRQLLQHQTDANLKFTPRRSDDMDLIFVAANSTQARLVVPQLRFFQGHDLPMYGTSYVYSGKPEPSVDADLDGLVFGDMKWMLEGVELYRREIAEQAAVRAAAEALEVEALEVAALELDGLELESVENNPIDEDVIADGVALLDNGGISADETQQWLAQMEADLGADLAADALNGGDLDSGDLGSEELGSEELGSEELGSDLLDNVWLDKDLLDNDLELVIEQVESKTQRPYKHTMLDRLYALGHISYAAIPRLSTMKNHAAAKYNGAAMTISVDQWGNVIRHPVWSNFSAGLAQPLDEVDQKTIQAALGSVDAAQ